jgi:peptidoglycan hydrolase-like protein with peptidoglycan-binding domain
MQHRITPLRLIRNNIMPTETINKPVLNSGSNGPAVTELQNLLNGYAEYLKNRAFKVTVDGDFGPMTLKAVRAFQRQVFLPQTGTVASLTWRSLYLRGPVELPQIGNGDSGDVVTLLQQALVSLGYLKANQVDGDFGPITRIAVTKYQIKTSLPGNGIVDTATWFALSKENRG